MRLFHRLFFFALCLLLNLIFSSYAGASDAPIVFLDEMVDQLSHSQGWGKLGINKAAWMNEAEAMPLRIENTVFERGMGCHASGEIRIPLQGQYASFSAEIGVQWQGGHKGSVVFEIWLDDEKVFTSPAMNDSDAPVPVQLPLGDAQELRLLALDGGDGISCDMANWAQACLTRDFRIPTISPVLYQFGQTKPEPLPEMEGSFALAGYDDSAQAAFCLPLGRASFYVAPAQDLELSFDLKGLAEPFSIEAVLTGLGGGTGIATLALDSGALERRPFISEPIKFSVAGEGDRDSDRVTLKIQTNQAALVGLHSLDFICEGTRTHFPYYPKQRQRAGQDAPSAITLQPLLEKELIEWDWRMQDGIHSGAVRSHYRGAVEKALHEKKAHHFLEPADQAAFQEDYATLAALELDDMAPQWEVLWRELRTKKRDFFLRDLREEKTPLLFVKQAPGAFSHQLTQYYGRYARPGGGIFILEEPGKSMKTRAVTEEQFPQGSFMHPELSADAQHVLISFCETEKGPSDSFKGNTGHFYNIHEVFVDGAESRRLTKGNFDDFSPKWLPNGEIIFISTRRGGWHRCGTPGCEVYTLASMKADGQNLRVLSFHETQEWDPSVLNDGRVVYTRWDYVDRHAVHYQQLWVTRPDGTNPAIFYGNNTLNPVGVWEARSIPGSDKIMATAAPHHGMTAGSIILVDTSQGMDDLEPLTRLTEEVPFPESEALLLPHWRTEVTPEARPASDEMERWPGQCYRSPWPFSEERFLAAYSYDPLIGEPDANMANIFGIYLVDASGHRELLYRDLNIASLWPMPLKKRELPPVLPSTLVPDAPREGSFYLQNVYESDPALPPDEKITHLRLVQVLPKSTPGANDPMVGAANASPGRQVLGTVPVEEDGSAYFKAPSGVAIAFQALNESGQAVQVMRSLTYLQPGENVSCVGCHEPRSNTPPSIPVRSHALRRLPSEILPGPDGSKPLSYPLLVQPVLDKHCLSCHGADSTESSLKLTGTPEGRYTQSYNALIPHVAFSYWGRGTFPGGNSEPETQPGFFGARGSHLTKLLEEGHYDVELDGEDWDRLINWMDANALFYGTFNKKDQAKQQLAERIKGPELE
ncbi:MAG: hypothetical protein GX130_02030 [Candidatus Hydrogenedens sp.]|jgi:hypothetical protein|nr:hypothetical protein [Candidatus Hydrogenedens sp.]